MPEDEWTLVDEAALIIGTRRVKRAWRDPSFTFRGVPHAIPRTRGPVEIPFADRRRLVLDCHRKRAGRPKLWDYEFVEMRTADVERLAVEAKTPTKRPKATKRDREKKAARVEAARIWREKEAERARVGAEGAAKWLAREAERKAEEAKLAAEQRSERPDLHVGEILSSDVATATAAGRQEGAVPVAENMPVIDEPPPQSATKPKMAVPQEADKNHSTSLPAILPTNKTRKLALWLRSIYGAEKPGKTLEEMRADVREAASKKFGKFSDSMLKRAVQLAWPPDQMGPERIKSDQNGSM